MRPVGLEQEGREDREAIGSILPVLPDLPVQIFPVLGGDSYAAVCEYRRTSFLLATLLSPGV